MDKFSFTDDGCFTCRSLLKTTRLPVDKMAWVYMRREDASATLCCGRMNIESYFLMVHMADKTVHKFPCETSDDVKDLMAEICRRNPSVTSGYSEEKKAIFTKCNSSDGSIFLTEKTGQEASDVHPM